MIAAADTESSGKELTKNSQRVTRLLSLDCEEYLDNVVSEELELAEIEAAFQLSVAESDSDAEIDSSEEELKFEQLSVFEQLKLGFNKLEVLHKYMWVIVVLLSGFHWLSGSKYVSVAESLLTKPPAPPVPFFPNHSREIITDYYFGNHADSASLLRKSEIGVLLYYASWSLHSQEARTPFVEAATAFQFIPNIKFSAVNCNTKYGMCKRSFKLYSYPVIVGYVGKMFVQYNGPKTAQGIFRFARHLLKPIVKIDNLIELEERTSESKFLVIGYFPISAQKAYQEYTTFLAAAYKAANDFERYELVQFVVIQDNELAKALNMNWTDRIRVFVRKDKWTPVGSSYFLIRQTTSDDMVEWINARLDSGQDAKDIDWVAPGVLDTNGKSEVLFKNLINSTLAVLFTTNYEGFAESKSMKALRLVAQSYHQCEGQDERSFVGKIADVDMVADSQASCKEMSLSMEDVALCCQLIGISGACRNNNNVSTSFQADSYCSSISRVYSPALLSKKCCNYLKNPKSVVNQFQPTWEKKLNCEWYRLNKKTSYLSLKASNSVTISPELNPSVRGRGCTGNDTIKFLAIDKKHAAFYIKNWAIGDGYFDLDDRLKPDLFTIISNVREAHYLLKEPISSDSLALFIQQYHDEKLSKVVLSAKDEAVNVKKEPKKVNVIKFTVLTANSFEQFLVTKKQHDSVVFFTGGQMHGPSASVAYILHVVAVYFKEFDGLIKFYKIDTRSNNLNYQYTFERVPAMAFFKGHQRDSVSYPNSLPFTVPNILAFILSRCQSELRWRIALSSCSSTCVERNRIKLKRFVSHIDRDIRQYRVNKFHESRRPISHQQATKLQYFRVAIHRRILQKRAALHLDNVLKLLESGQVLDLHSRDEIIRQSLFVRWLLYNHFEFNHNN